jgi:hypothetical protein
MMGDYYRIWRVRRERRERREVNNEDQNDEKAEQMFKAPKQPHKGPLKSKIGISTITCVIRGTRESPVPKEAITSVIPPRPLCSGVWGRMGSPLTIYYGGACNQAGGLHSAMDHWAVFCSNGGGLDAPSPPVLKGLLQTVAVIFV